jgi:hypothetical protein
MLSHDAEGIIHAMSLSWTDPVAYSLATFLEPTSHELTYLLNYLLHGATNTCSNSS